MQAIELLGHARSGGARDDVDALRGSHILASLHLDELWHVLRRLPTHDRWQRAFQVDLERDLLRTRSRILELRAKGVRIDTTPTPRLLEILHGLAPASAPASFVRVQVHLALAAVRELLSGKAIPECVEEAAS